MTEPQSPRDVIHATLRRPAAFPSGAREPLVDRFHVALDRYVTPRRLGRVWSRIKVVLDWRSGLILQPDITFLVYGRESIVRDFVWGPPDMVLELTLPPTPSSQLEERVARFSVHGVREYWLVQPDKRKMALLELAHGGVRSRTLFDHRTPIKTPLFPEFAIPLSEILR
jgi:Uma2 family endonuclease